MSPKKSKAVFIYYKAMNFWNVFFFSEKSILVANKREKNLKDLLLRSDPYNIKRDLQIIQSMGASAVKEMWLWGWSNNHQMFCYWKNTYNQKR